MTSTYTSSEAEASLVSLRLLMLCSSVVAAFEPPSDEGAGALRHVCHERTSSQFLGHAPEWRRPLALIVTSTPAARDGQSCRMRRCGATCSASFRFTVRVGRRQQSNSEKTRPACWLRPSRSQPAPEIAPTQKRSQ